MFKIGAIAKRECLAYFYSPIFYAAATFVTLIIGIVANAIVRHNGGIEADIGYVAEVGAMLLLFITPMLAMRLFSEEFKQGTVETLMTAPVTDWQVVLGKYLAGILVLIAMFVPSLVHLAVFYALGNSDPARGAVTDPALIKTLILYGALIGIAAFYAAVGLMASALTRDQVVAALVGFGINFAFLIVHQWLGQTDFVKNSERLKAAVDYVNIYAHLTAAFRGIIDTRDVVFFVAAIVFLLFVTTRLVESRKWRG